MASRGITVKDVPADEFIEAFAKYLKRSGKIDVPKWVDIVKTASMARKIYLRPAVGVGSFRKIYGGAKNNGTKPSHFALSSGSVARHILKQLEAIKIVEKDSRGGRSITTTGRRDLDRIAGQLVKKTTKTPKKKSTTAATTTPAPSK